MLNQIGQHPVTLHATSTMSNTPSEALAKCVTPLPRLSRTIMVITNSSLQLLGYTDQVKTNAISKGCVKFCA